MLEKEQQEEGDESSNSASQAADEGDEEGREDVEEGKISYKKSFGSWIIERESLGVCC